MSYFNDNQASGFYDNYEDRYSEGYSRCYSPSTYSIKGKVIHSTEKAHLVESDSTEYIIEEARKRIQAEGITFYPDKLVLRAWFPKRGIHEVKTGTIKIYSWCTSSATAYYDNVMITDIIGD